MTYYSNMDYNKEFKKDWEMMSEDEKSCMKITIPEDWILKWVNDEEKLSFYEYHMAIELMRKNLDIKRLLSNGL